MGKNSIVFAGFEDGGRISQVKERGYFLEAGETRTWILLETPNKECSPGVTLILTQCYSWESSEF